jgi:D-alanyl-D-alanine carboxypeptidase (penicillin-binding protein 5/6)
MMDSTHIENSREQREGRGKAVYFYTVPILLIILLLGAIQIFIGNEKERVVISDIEKKESSINPFDTVHVSAKAAYVFDANTQTVLFSQNEERQLPLASLAKLVTALIAAEALNASEAIFIAPDAIEAEGDSGLFAHERWRLGDLVSFTLISSSNDGASALASVVNARIPSIESKNMVDMMNGKTAELGLSQTYFINETGLDKSANTGGAYGSARDMAILLQYMFTHHPSLIESTKYEKETFVSLDSFEHEAKNTNEAAHTIPGFLGGKTGFTDLAGGNLIIAFNAGLNRPVIISVLGGTKEGRFRDTEALAAAARAYIARK